MSDKQLQQRGHIGCATPLRKQHRSRDTCHFAHICLFESQAEWIGNVLVSMKYRVYKVVGANKQNNVMQLDMECAMCVFYGIQINVQSKEDTSLR